MTLPGNQALPTLVELSGSSSLSMAYLNSYIGCASTTTRQLSGEDQYPAWTIAQIFNSEYDSTTVPLVGTPSLPSQSIADLAGRTFGIYQDASRLNLYASTFATSSLPVFIGYLGFGPSGMFSPANKGFPVKIVFEVVFGDAAFITAEYVEEDPFTWRNLPVNPGVNTYIVNAAHLRLRSDSLTPSQIDLTVYPCLDGSTSGTGYHNLVIDMPAEGDIDPPPGDGGGEGPPGDGGEPIIEP